MRATAVVFAAGTIGLVAGAGAVGAGVAGHPHHRHGPPGSTPAPAGAAQPATPGAKGRGPSTATGNGQGPKSCDHAAVLARHPLPPCPGVVGPSETPTTTTTTPTRPGAAGGASSTSPPATGTRTHTHTHTATGKAEATRGGTASGGSTALPFIGLPATQTPGEALPLPSPDALDRAVGVPLSVALVIAAAGLATAFLVLHGTIGRRRPRPAAAAYEDSETLGFR